MALDRILISRRLGLLVVMACLALIIQISVGMLNLHNNLLEDRKREVKAIVEIAHSTVLAKAEAARSGRISEEKAKADALNVLRSMRYEGDNYVWVTDFDAAMVMHPIKPGLDGKKLGKTKDDDGKFIFADFASIAQNEGSGFDSYVWPKPGSDIAVPKTAYIKAYAPWGWAIGTGLYVDDVDAVFMSTLIQLGGIAFVVMVVMLGFSVVIARSIAEPVNAMTDFMETLATGNKSTEVPGTMRQDEVGRMARSVEVFRASMIRSDELAAQQQAGHQEQADRARRIAAYAADFDHHIAGVIGNVSAAVQHLQDTADTLKYTASQTTTQATTASAASEQSSGNVQMIATASQQVAGSITEISSQIHHSNTLTRQAANDAGRTRETINSLAETGLQIGEVVDLINEIAEKTNMLALNATIESARAGESGRGFAVVANEVKSLAQQTRHSTEEINTHINAVQHATQSAVDEINHIADSMNDANSITTTIAAAIEEQQAATGEIARNVEQAAIGSQEVADNMVSVSQGATKADDASAKVQEASQHLSKEAESLKQIVETFLQKVKAA